MVHMDMPKPVAMAIQLTAETAIKEWHLELGQAPFLYDTRFAWVEKGKKIQIFLKLINSYEKDERIYRAELQYEKQMGIWKPISFIFDKREIPMFTLKSLIEAADNAAKMGLFDYAHALLSAAGKSPDWPEFEGLQGREDRLSRLWRAKRHNWYEAMKIANKVRNSRRPIVGLTGYSHEGFKLTHMKSADSESWIKTYLGMPYMTVRVPLDEIYYNSDAMGVHTAVMFEDASGNVWFYRRSMTQGTMFFGQVFSLQFHRDNGEMMGSFSLVIYRAGEFDSGLVPQEALDALDKALDAATKEMKISLQFFSVKSDKFHPIEDLLIYRTRDWNSLVTTNEVLSRKLEEFVLAEALKLGEWAAKLDEHWINTQKLAAEELAREEESNRRRPVREVEEPVSGIAPIDLSQFDEDDDK